VIEASGNLRGGPRPEISAGDRPDRHPALGFRIGVLPLASPRCPQLAGRSERHDSLEADTEMPYENVMVPADQRLYENIMVSVDQTV
jgi:hypothetical protein